MAWLFKFKGKSKVWWLGFRQNGTQVLKSTGHTDQKRAEAELHKVEAMIAAKKANALTLDLYQALSGKSLPKVTLRAALDDWISETKGAAGPRTLTKYKALADEVTESLNVTDLGPLASDVTREQIQSFLDHKRQTVSASTVNMARKCLAVFFKRCKGNKVVRDNPMEGIKSFKASRDEKRSRRPFTVAEISALYDQAPDDFWRYMVLAGFYTGLRLGDLVTIPVGAVDLKTHTINVLTRKTGATVHIPIAAPLHALLSRLKKERQGAKTTDPFWPEHAKRYEESGPTWFSQRFYDLLLLKAGLVASRPHRKGTKSKAGLRTVNAVSFHCFRHSYVSTLTALGLNQQTVKALVGHSSDEINDLYTTVPQEVMAQGVALLPDITKKAQ